MGLPDELDSIQADADELLIELGGTAQVLDLALDSDGAGGFDEEWTPRTAIPGRIAQFRATRGGQMEAGAIDERSTHIVTLPAGTTINHENRIRIAGGDWEVTGIRHRTDEMVVRVEVMAALPDKDNQ